MAALSESQDVDFRAVVRKPLYIPDTQSLGRMIVEMQTARAKSAIVLDDHGTAIGMAFLEDAIEEIVGPIQDEFDDEEPPISQDGEDKIEMRGDVPLPEVADLLGLTDDGTDDTIGGHVVSLLGRLPQEGDRLKIGDYHVKVVEVANRRVVRLCFERKSEESTSG